MSLALTPGVVVGGRYRLEQPIGGGGMGSVWSAVNTATGRAVALKFLRGPAHVRATLRRRLLREARAATAVGHPNVVEVLDLFEHDDETPVLVMDLLHGETLRDRLIRQETLSIEECARILVPVISAVGTAHERGVVHRDLKPENVFLERPSAAAGDERALVLDFGIAKLLDREPDDGALVTHTGSTLGTPCYMAPEQAIAARDIDHRADVWALGVILYECLTGVRPIEGDNVGQVVMHLMSTGITPIERIRFDLPEDVTALIGRMLARERDHRSSDLREAFEVLSKYGAISAAAFGPPRARDGSPAAEPTTLEPRTPGADPGGTGRRPRRGRSVVLAVMAALLALGTLAGTATLLRSPRAEPAPGTSREPALGSCEMPRFANPSCSSCTRASCEEALAACGSDHRCCTVFSCLAACAPDDPSCRFACTGSRPLEGPLIALEQCRRSKCASACIGDHGFFRPHGERCEACARTDCAAQTRACANDVECDAQVYCATACEDHDCREECRARAATGKSACDFRWRPNDQAVARCILEGCSLECGFHDDWSCVGKYRWRGKLADELERPVWFEWGPAAPVAGASVRVCQPTDRECTEPIDQRVTQGDGFACLDLTAAPAAGFRGYFEVTHPGAIPMLSYQAAPIARGHAVDSRPVFPTQLLTQVETALGRRTSPSKGHVVLVVSDCSAIRGRGLTVSTDAEHVLRAYLDGQMPNPAATATDADSGAVLFVDVAPGLAQLTARKSDQIVACPRVLVRPGKLTFVHAHPRDADTTCE